MFLSNVRTTADGPAVDIHTDDSRVTAITEAGAHRPARGDEVLECGGGVVVPGFVDNHVHLTQWALTLRYVDVGTAESADEVVDRVAVSDFGGTILRASGFRDALWPIEPHKDMLERALPGRAVAITSMDLHTLWLSPTLLHRLGIEHPTGVVRDHDCLAVMNALDALGDTADTDAAALAATEELARRGITEVVDFEYADNHTVWRRRSDLAVPGVRVRASVWPEWLEAALDRDPGARSSVSNVVMGPLKVMFDGSLNTRTACCHDPYPGMSGDAAHGLLLETPENLASLMARAASGGIFPAIHAIGDRANSLVLDAFEAVGCIGRIEHAQQVLPEDLERFARLGVIASVQPQHAMADRDVADELWDGRRSRSFPYGSLHAAGATLRFGSDAPVSAPEPLAAVADAVWRTDDERPPWHLDESVPLEVAMRAICGGRGRLQEGDAADLVVLAEDPVVVGSVDIRSIPVLGTVASGRVTHRAGSAGNLP